MTRVRPPCPFPPHDGDPEGVIDLGVRLRDTLFRKNHIERTVRPALRTRLDKAIEANEWDRAEMLLRALIDSWPVAATVNAARRAWTAGPEGAALAVLHRAAELTALASNAPLGWPTPTSAWVKRIVGNRLVTAVERRCEHDGAIELAEIWQVQVVEADTTDLPEVVRSVLAGEAATLQEDARSAVERYGLYGAEVPDAPSWAALIRPAPPGLRGAVLTPRAYPIELPGTPGGLADGQPNPTAWLVWNGPFRPVAVTAAAAAVLAHMDGLASVGDIAERIAAPLGATQDVARALCALGACADNTGSTAH